MPRWQQVVARGYEPWDRDRLVVDTALADPSVAAQRVAEGLRERGQP